ncbi:hypothetical protein BAUCODRAFT_555968 [Baudoinia panamericana UAMH 10762]|uniref:Uncharacterized protein n=1 Tax=Baudoinia panamericana (strain UAMH 10762) TaxID=717646 RepID=M2LK94_BAUPA|nr:uncharacterized protein BAUCODRAFT_555968 [Baudoinia panamericana UAMH 10762]EMC94677.1 hypothetical protein BAUCODRAFT_555968 [Baudoinia panamericana UAMH 10762]
MFVVPLVLQVTISNNACHPSFHTRMLSPHFFLSYVVSSLKYVTRRWSDFEKDGHG